MFRRGRGIRESLSQGGVLLVDLVLGKVIQIECMQDLFTRIRIGTVLQKRKIGRERGRGNYDVAIGGLGKRLAEELEREKPACGSLACRKASVAVAAKAPSSVCNSSNSAGAVACRPAASALCATIFPLSIG